MKLTGARPPLRCRYAAVTPAVTPSLRCTLWGLVCSGALAFRRWCSYSVLLAKLVDLQRRVVPRGFSFLNCGRYVLAIVCVF